jgi:hypothetical protein
MTGDPIHNRRDTATVLSTTPEGASHYTKDREAQLTILRRRNLPSTVGKFNYNTKARELPYDNKDRELT